MEFQILGMRGDSVVIGPVGQTVRMWDRPYVGQSEIVTKLQPVEPRCICCGGPAHETQGH